MEPAAIILFCFACGHEMEAHPVPEGLIPFARCEECAGAMFPPPPTFEELGL